MLRLERSSAGRGLLALFLAAGCWFVSDADARAAPSSTAGSAKAGHFNPGGAQAKRADLFQTAGAAKAGYKEALAKIEQRIEREIAELKQLEQAIERMLGQTSGGNGSPTAQSSTSASPSTAHKHKHKHRHGHFGRGMELARLMHQMAREERKLEHMEHKLEKQLAELKHLEKHLRHLEKAGNVGKKASVAQAKSTATKTSTAKSTGGQKGTTAGVSTKGTAQPHAAKLTGHAVASTPHAGTAHAKAAMPKGPRPAATAPHPHRLVVHNTASRASSGARGVGHAIAGHQQHASSQTHHSSGGRHR